MKNLIILLYLVVLPAVAQQSITGRLLDVETQNPLVNGNIVIANKNIGSSTNREGKFSLQGNIDPGDIIQFSYIGYTPQKITVTQNYFTDSLIIYLSPAIIPSQTVFIEASLGKEGFTPVTFEQIKREDIEKDYTVQDIPQFLGELPSTNVYSENGNGLGYNYLSIRGFDQRRISVSINGIPQNDPEDHNVYWLDFPDLLESTDLIQVQRGAGSGIFGYPAIGGSINIITSTFSSRRKFSFSASLGSYNTRKFSTDYSTGLLNNKHAFYLKLSNITSSGYRDGSWIDYKSYHFSAVRYDKDFTTQLNLFGGPIEDGLAYTGLPKFAVKDKNLRRKNYSYWETAGDSISYSISRRVDEKENFFQPHFELLNEYRNGNVTFNSALFYVYGTGFFDYDGSWSVFYDDYFRLKESGFDTSYVPQNAIIRALVKNRQFGWLPRVSIDHTNGKFIAGAELRIHRSDHWGEINSAENLPPGFSSSYRYYSYNGAKDIFGFFINESYSLTESFNVLAEAQLVYHKYKLFNEKFVGTEFLISNIFLNPRLGLNYKFLNDANLFVTFARVSREPRLKNYYDAAESSGGEVPQFEITPLEMYDFEKPLVLPETMNDLEIGANYKNEKLSLSLNLFYMLFNNEIVKNGKLDRFGQPVTGNVENTLHQGIEISAAYKLIPQIEIYGNTTFSRNEIKEGRDYLSAVDFIDLSGNRISGFPDFIANIGVQAAVGGFYLKVIGKYVGGFFSDNYDTKLSSYLIQIPGFVSYSDNKNDPYFNSDLILSYKFNLFSFLNESKITLQVMNLFDRLYSANAIGGEFFPAAERQFLGSIKIGI